MSTDSTDRASEDEPGQGSREEERDTRDVEGD